MHTTAYFMDFKEKNNERGGRNMYRIRDLL